MQNFRFAGPARLYFSAAFFCALCCFLPPLLWAGGAGDAGETPPLLSGSPAPVQSAPAAPSPLPSTDAGRTVAVLQEDGSILSQPLSEYLWGVVAAEMPASFEPEALRAQAVCARTYTVWMMTQGSKHAPADICTDSSCCQAYTTQDAASARWGSLAVAYTEKISAAVADTDGTIAAYDGMPIQALFFSSSAGATEDASAVWGNALPYLASVPSPEGEEVPNYHSTVTLSPEDARARITAAYPEAVLSDSPAEWFSPPTYTATGRVAELTVGGITLSGGAARSLFSLRSSYFRVDASDEAVTFSVTGYGHGVGLSQYGANAMARAGSGWQDILTHYYTGITLQQGW